MFLHQKELQFEAKTRQSKPINCGKYLQELIGSQYGEIRCSNVQYLFQGWAAVGGRKVQRYVDGHCDRRNWTR